LFFCKFGFWRSSCTSYIKWVYYWCQMVVLLSVNYFKLPLGWRDYFVFFTFGFCRFSCTSCNRYIWILFFLHLVFTWFLVLSILSGRTARVECLYYSSSNFWTSLQMTGLFYFFLHLDFITFIELPIITCCDAHVEWLYFSASSTSYNKWL
jgi:hypothetical protein